MRRLALGAVVVGLMASVAAAQQNDGPAPDPCTLVTTAALQAIVHQAVQGPKPAGAETCAWQIGGMNAITIQVNPTGQGGFDNAQSETANAVALSGIGDAAFAFSSQAGFVEVNVLKNNRYVVVIYQGGANATRLAMTKVMAVAVAGNL